jgi:DNA-binding Xre family transcriptional regulator
MTHLAQMLIAYQQKHDLEGKNLAREIGIQESSLTRIKQGKMPDAAGVVKIIAWLFGESR